MATLVRRFLAIEGDEYLTKFRWNVRAFKDRFEGLLRESVREQEARLEAEKRRNLEALDRVGSALPTECLDLSKFTDSE